jgi:hypothetical protein
MNGRSPVSRRIDAVDADLLALLADTEAHLGVYRLKDNGE